MTSVVIHSVLIFDGKPVGLRCRVNDKFYDVEIEKLRSVKSVNLKKFKAQQLIPHGNILVTEEELRNGLIVEDVSENVRFVEAVVNILQALGGNGKSPVNASKVKGKLKVFDVVVEVPFYNPVISRFGSKRLEGEFESVNALVARKEAKEFYAAELGISMDDVKIVSCKIRD